MTVTPAEVMRGLIEIARDLNAATEELAELDLKAVEAKGRYEVARATAFLTTSGTVEDRKTKALLATEAERQEAEIAEALVRACKERIRTLHARVEVGRSLGTGLRAEMNTLGMTP